MHLLEQHHSHTAQIVLEFGMPMAVKLIDLAVPVGLSFLQQIMCNIKMFTGRGVNKR